MPKYIDGFVIPVPQDNLAAYQKMSKKACKVWMEYGALDYIETVGDDMEIKGMATSFPKLAKVKPGEVVVFSYIVYKSRAHRDKVNAQVMKDPRLNEMCDGKNMPFNPKRMAYGGFKSIVEA
ncbi:MAG TPA: DUF1428 domain-containing protein [Prosthecobacter sp.]|nr:DUF1428 domain-containing protein [Prosthecobacter sp.]